MIDRRISEAIHSYLSDKHNYSPFFVVCESLENYSALLSEFSHYKKLCISDFCISDSFADIDNVCDKLTSISEPTILYGFGEYILTSSNRRALSRVKELHCGSKLIVFYRGNRDDIKDLANVDVKFKFGHFVDFYDSKDFSLCLVKNTINTSKYDIFKNYHDLMVSLEKGLSDKVIFTSNLPINCDYAIESAFDFIMENRLLSNVHRELLDESQWNEYLSDSNLENFGILNWRSYLKYVCEPSDNLYIRTVVNNSKNYNEYIDKFYSYILSLDHTSQSYNSMYMARKEAVCDQRDFDVNLYIRKANTIKECDEIYYLTDNTEIEKYEIIKCIGRTRQIPDNLEMIYFDLSIYLKSFNFRCDNSSELVDYFDEYKQLKVKNMLSDDFKNKVDRMASNSSMIYVNLPTRNSIVGKMKKNGNYLYWIDALGVEFLSYIRAKACENDLNIDVTLTRASLPTITSENSDFYYQAWDNDNKNCTKKLDEIKHDGEQFSYSDSSPYPVHLVAEMEVIEKVIKDAASKLKQAEFNKVVITSDHGATRLAVLNHNEIIFEMKEKGKHSGRCCPKNDFDDTPSCAIEESGFWSLANYDRFKGGQKARVEVHGGATLEEVIVPVITLELANIKEQLIAGISFVDGNVGYVSYDEEPCIKIKSELPIAVPLVCVGGKMYNGICLDNRVYSFKLSGYKEKGCHNMSIYDGDNFIVNMEIIIQARVGRDDSFDFFS